MEIIRINNDKAGTIVELKTNVDLYVCGKLRVMNVTAFTMGANLIVVSLSADHKPNRQIYFPVIVYYSSKTYLGYLASVENTSGSADFRAYYCPSYAGSATVCPSGASLYGVIPYYTA